VSESSASDACSDDDDVDVSFTGSAFSVSGGGDALHALASRLRRNSGTFLLGHKAIINRHKPQHRGQDPSKQALIHHFFPMPTPRAHHRPPRLSLAVISLLFGSLRPCCVQLCCDSLSSLAVPFLFLFFFFFFFLLLFLQTRCLL
jgi:hypothetical protein